MASVLQFLVVSREIFCFLQNGDAPQDASMDVDQPERNLVNLDSNPVAIERVLAFGRDLQVMYSELKTNKPNKQLKTLLQVCKSIT